MSWYVLAYDEYGETIEMRSPDPEALVNRAASWAQQEADRWPDMGLIYMLVHEHAWRPLQVTQEPASIDSKYPMFVRTLTCDCGETIEERVAR